MTWSRARRLTVRLPIFIIMIGVLVFVSNATTVPWNNEPTGQTIAALSSDTAVTFDNPDGVALHHVGDYRVVESSVWIEAKRASTGETQRIRVLIRQPRGTASAGGGTHPGVVFMHGAGHGGSPDDSFNDVATAMASAGFVTAVIDKPIWSPNDITRDYPASADAYDQVIDYLRGLGAVDPAQVGVYATSESTWITPYLLERDPDVAFQILLSPMVYSPRQALGFFVSQDFALVGANDGYQSIVRRVFSADAALFGLTNLDLDAMRPQSYAIPTYVAYGSKDVMTAQVEGVETILDMAHRAGNWDVTVRSYPVANHVLRMGHDEEVGTPFADAYVEDLTDWAAGTVAGLHQTSERLAGDALYQSIAVPTDLHPRRVLTVYGVILHCSTVVTLLSALAVSLVALARGVRCRLRRWRRRADGGGGDGDAGRRPTVLGFEYGFGGALLTLTLTTLGTTVLFVAGLGQVIMGVVQLAWGSAPDEHPGIMQWSWPVIQMVCTIVVWAWSGVLTRLLDVAQSRGIIRFPPCKGSIRALVTGKAPVLASTRLGRVLFWLTAAAMLHILLVFAFWGLFVY